MVTLQDFLHRLKTSWTTLHFSIVDSGSVAKVKSGRQHDKKKHIDLEGTLLLVFLYLFLLYFVKISEESIRTDKIELSVLDILLSALTALSLYIFFATGKPETWKESHHERDPSVRDIFPYVACLTIGAGNERRKGILDSIIILQLIFINKFCCSNPQSSVLWSQLASYLLQACPDELQV